ncbi:MAG: hypothetical protein AB1390_10105 [Nitrospirota bacterium]
MGRKEQENNSVMVSPEPVEGSNHDWSSFDKRSTELTPKSQDNIVHSRSKKKIDAAEYLISTMNRQDSIPAINV